MGMLSSTSAGYVRVFFDPRISEKGAVITAGRAPKREKDPSDYASVGEIYNPHALPMYKVSVRICYLIIVCAFDLCSHVIFLSFDGACCVARELARCQAQKSRAAERSYYF